MVSRCVREGAHPLVATLYQQKDPTPPGRPVPTQVTPFSINNYIPTEAEVVAEICHLRLNKAGGHTQLRVEHCKKCPREAYLVEGTSTP